MTIDDNLRNNDSLRKSRDKVLKDMRLLEEDILKIYDSAQRIINDHSDPELDISDDVSICMTRYSQILGPDIREFYQQAIDNVILSLEKRRESKSKVSYSVICPEEGDDFPDEKRYSSSG